MFDLKRDLEIAVEHFQNLRIIETGSNLSLSGEVNLFHPTENEWIGSFSVDISFPENFPYRFPIVYEVSGKIRRIQDRHIYPNTGNMCFAVYAEELIKCKYGITTIWFLKNVLVPRLAEEYRVNHGGTYAHGFSHGVEGDLEFYFEKFKTRDYQEVIRYLQSIRSQRFPKHYQECICGSGSKFKKCHKSIFEEMSLLGGKVIDSEISKLENYQARNRVNRRSYFGSQINLNTYY